MLTLLGRLNSSNVQTVVIALDELHLSYERRDVGGAFGGNASTDYLANNPTGLVPTLLDGALAVWESNAIIRYLANRYGPTPLYPTDAAARSHVDRWLDWRQTSLGPHIGPVFVAYVRTPPAQRDRVATLAHELHMLRYLQMMDAHLATRTWLAGGDYTLADVGLAMFVHRSYAVPIETVRPAFPHLRRWYDAIGARAAVSPLFALPLS